MTDKALKELVELRGWRPIGELRPTALDSIVGTILNRRGVATWVDICTFVERKPDDDREGQGWCAYHGDVSPTHYWPIDAPGFIKARTGEDQ